MALAFSIRLQFLDAKGKSSFTKVRVPTTFAISDYLEFVQASAQLFSNLSQGQVSRGAICFGIDLSGLGLATVASAVSSVAKKLSLRFRTAATGFFAKMNMPTISELLFPGGGDAIDDTDADVAAVVSALEDGLVVTGGTVNFTNDREQDIVTYQSGRERFRRRSSG